MSYPIPGVDPENINPELDDVEMTDIEQISREGIQKEHERGTQGTQDIENTNENQIDEMYGTE